QSIVAGKDVVAIGGSDGIMTLETDGHVAPRRQADSLRVRRLSTPPMQRAGANVLAELEDGSACLLDIGNDHVEEVNGYAEPRWFARLARLGNLLAYRVTDANRLELYRLGPSVVR